ncbi:hypothetical protein BU25DRAFT_61175 [Macroventuria anomochaeta]|uniref:Uncharacterized protein n=1 Tax=Macroventuria anomochaeta TaxID=301207 RepID=A0ACB6RZU6_9PLEO|nr:uncharacterized protein BU25DRAFT_61175 [Macroventuria anomochaeta]KAF2627304.1 hypothetical protein BU25DRAFT_61175 [Macroventuria anomochaeta]
MYCCCSCSGLCLSHRAIRVCLHDVSVVQTESAIGTGKSTAPAHVADMTSSLHKLSHILGYNTVLVCAGRVVVTGYSTVLICAGRVWVATMFWVATKLAVTVCICATRVWVEVEVAVRVVVTAAPAIFDVRVTAGRVDVIVANEVIVESREDVRLMVEVSIENEVTVTGVPKGEKEQPVS